MLELKVRKPQRRGGFVPRSRLLSRIHDSEAQVISVIAPGGYGKSTLLAQLVEDVETPVAWLTLDETDNDPTALIAAFEFALGDAGLISPSTTSGSVSSNEALTIGVRRLLGKVDRNINGLIVVDNVEQLADPSATDVVGAIIVEAIENLRFVLASRPNTALPVPLLRSRGALLELGPEDLAMNSSEVKQLFDSMDLGHEDVESVLDATEGWPVGIYLTALALRHGSSTNGDREIRGNDVFIADYIREELIKEVGSDMESFLLRSSVVPRMSADLCDEVLQVTNSNETLQQLEASNLLIVPLDHNRTWYRYHSLLRDYLRSEFHARHPELERDLHARASEWFKSRNFTELAIEHARLAGDEVLYIDLVKESSRRFYAEGKIQTMSRWLDHLEDSGSIVDHPELAATGALARALDGDAGGAEQLARYAYRDAVGIPRADADLGPIALLLRSYQAPMGADQSLRDAQSSYDILQHPSEWTPGSLGAIALATAATDGLDAADPILADALWRGESIVAHPLSTAAKAMRAAAAIRSRDWDRAQEFANTAIEEVEFSGLTSYLTSCLPYTVAARVASRLGDNQNAARYLGLASAMRHRLTVALPLYSVITLHEQALAYIEVGDIAGARRVARDAADILALRPKLGHLSVEHEELNERLKTMPTGAVGASSLTRSELRIVPLLPTHLTYPEIGERLYLSRHTVKTHAMSIYRKLGVSSRGEAVAKAAEIGLIHN